MCLEIDVRGIAVYLRIKGYKKCLNDIYWVNRWCKCDLALRSGDWLDYHFEDEECLLWREIEQLEMSLTKLLNGELNDVTEINCMEPDFVFVLHPKRDDFRNEPSDTLIRPGYEIEDICMEWRVYFWDVGLTHNFLTVELRRDEIAILRDYLSSVMKEAENERT